MKLPLIPSTLDAVLGRYLRDLTVTLGSNISRKVDRDTPTDQLLLVSPSKKIYSVTVSDAGAISATLVQE